jgi:hypothetical protein
MQRTSDRILSIADRKRLAFLIAKDGQIGVARLFCLGRSTIAQAAAGLPIQRATHAVIVAKLDEVLAQ